MRAHPRGALALGLLTLTGCIQMASDGSMVPPDQPISVRQVAGQYDAFAACAFLRLQDGTSVKMTDLRAINTVRIYQEVTSGFITTQDIRFWDMTIRQAAPNAVEVSIKAPATIYGPDHYARQIWDKIGPCVRPNQT